MDDSQDQVVDETAGEKKVTFKETQEEKVYEKDEEEEKKQTTETKSPVVTETKQGGMKLDDVDDIDKEDEDFHPGTQQYSERDKEFSKSQDPTADTGQSDQSPPSSLADDKKEEVQTSTKPSETEFSDDEGTQKKPKEKITAAQNNTDTDSRAHLKSDDDVSSEGKPRTQEETSNAFLTDDEKLALKSKPEDKEMKVKTDSDKDSVGSSHLVHSDEESISSHKSNSPDQRSLHSDLSIRSDQESLRKDYSSDEDHDKEKTKAMKTETKQSPGKTTTSDNKDQINAKVSEPGPSKSPSKTKQSDSRQTSWNTQGNTSSQAARQKSAVRGTNNKDGAKKQDPQSPRYIVAKDRASGQQRLTKSALPGGRGRNQPSVSRESTMSSRASSRVPSRARTTLGFNSERKQREFFKAELERLKNSLRKEAEKIKRPKVKDYYPYVFNTLEPYYNTYTAKYLIQMPDYGYDEKQPDLVKETMERKKDDGNKELPFATRSTAIGLCDPWINLEMDKSVLPKLETAEMKRKRMAQVHEASTPRKSAEQKKKSKEPKEGSTRLPKFPVINLVNTDLATRELVYSDVPMIRNELAKNYTHSGKDRVQGDYIRTKQDFYRMELDRLDEYHDHSRDNMKAAYFAYLTNTPGSRKAISDCMRKTNGKKKSKPEEQKTSQAVA